MAIAVTNTAGQLPASKTTLYTTPSASKGYLKSIILKNTGGASETVQLYFNVAGVSREFPTIILGADESAVIDSSGMQAGTLIEGETTNPNVVDYFMCIVQDSR